MPKYTVSVFVTWRAEATIEIEAANEHDARAQAQDNHGLSAIDGNETDAEVISIECLDDATDEYDEYKYVPEEHLATPAPEAKITMPCPEPTCKGTLEVRTNRKNGSEFLGCNYYPECRHTQPLTEYLKLKKLGAPTLF